MSMQSPVSPVVEDAASVQKYNRLVRITHWLMAICFVFAWVSGFTMRNLMTHDSPAQELIYDLHKSVGVTLITLFLARIFARSFSRIPQLPDCIPPGEQRMAKIGHIMIYALSAAALVTGWALTDFGGHGVVWFGVPMPQIFPVQETMFGITLDPLTSDIHAWLAYALLAFVAIHVTAVLKHRWIDGIDLLPRIAIRLVRRN